MKEWNVSRRMWVIPSTYLVLHIFGGRSEVDDSVGVGYVDEVDGLVEAECPAEVGGPAEAGGSVAEAGGGPPTGAEGRELAEAAGVAETGLVAEAEKVSIVTLLVSASSPADAPTEPLRGLGRQS